MDNCRWRFPKPKRSGSFLAKEILRLQHLECEEIEKKLEYMHGDPVKRKLVTHL